MEKLNFLSLYNLDVVLHGEGGVDQLTRAGYWIKGLIAWQKITPWRELSESARDCCSGSDKE
jgi:hypothetical protein